MDKVVIKRAAIMLGLIVIIIGITFACDLIVNRDTSPVLSDPDAIFATVSEVEMTNQEWYEVAKSADGITQILNMVDEIILSDMIEDVTQEEIDETLLELQYGTTNQEDIDALSAYQREKALQDYNDLVLISGFDPEDASSVERFVRLSIAKENLAYDQIASSEFLTDEVLETYYNNNVKGDLQAVVVRFQSLAEMNEILSLRNLVLGFEDGMGLYEGDTPIDDVASDGFTENNTRLLDEAEVLNIYLELYDYLYPYKEVLPTEVDKETLVGLSLEYIMYDFEEMTSDEASAGLEALANYLFVTLRASENPYSTSSRNIEGERVLAFVLEDNEAPLFEDLSASDLESLKDDYVTSVLSQTRVEDEMAVYRESLGFELYDTLLASQYEQGTSIDPFTASSDDALIAVIDGNDITVDAFFEFMADRVSALYALDLIRDRVLLESTYFEELYGTNRDLFNNSTDAMVEYRDQIRTDKVNFSNGAYAQFGFTPDRYTWEEFLQAGYGLDSEYEYLLALSLGDVRTQFMLDRLDFDLIMTYVEDATDNYMSLNVEQLLLYVDMDGDFEPDDFDEYYESLSAMDQGRINAALANFENYVEDALNDGDTLSDILLAFRDGLRSENEDDDDYSEFAKLKNLGFHILFEDLSAEASITYQSAKAYVLEFLDALIDFYDMYQEAENIDLDELLYDQVVRTQFGLHILLGSPGTDFEKPDAALTSEIIRDYVTFVAENRNLDPTTLENDLRFDLSDEIYESIQAFYEPLNDLFFGSNYFNGLFIEDVYSDVEFTLDDSYHSDILRTLGELFERRGLPITRAELE